MADVTLNATAARQPLYGGSSGPFWYSTTVGYKVLLENSVLKYQKTTDGGQTWGAGVSIGSGAGTASLTGFAAWAGKNTPGQSSNTKIYIAWEDLEASRSIKFRTLDTSDDSLGTERTVASGITTNTGDSLSIVLGVGGKLYITGGNVSGRHGYRSTDEFATAAVAMTSPMEVAASDYCTLFPANLADTNDIWALFWDLSVNLVTVKTYDDSLDSWSESSGASAADQTVATIGNQFNGAIRHSDGHLIWGVWTIYDNSTADLTMFDWDGSTNTALTNVITNIDDCAGVAICVDQATSDIYVGYIGKSDGSETMASTVKIYYKKSTDDGTTWDSEVPYSEDTGDDFRCVQCDPCVGHISGRFALCWYDDDDVDLFYGYTNSVAINAAAPAGYLPGTPSGQSGQRQQHQALAM